MIKQSFSFKVFWLVLVFCSTLLFSAGETVQEYVINHVIDADEWHPLPFISIEFPKIAFGEFYSFEKGLHFTMLFLALIFLVIVFVLLYNKKRPYPKGFTNLLEVFVLFVRNEISISNLGEKDGRKYTPFFLTLFFFILMLNIMGLIPLFSTASANINVTAGLAIIIFFMMITVGFMRKGPIGFFKTFIPSGVPKPVLVILFPIELVGLIIKPFALLIRLFANMLAGHLIIFSILGVIITFGYAGLPSFFLALFIYILEILVAFIQAYIFTLLSAMFVGEMMHHQH